MERAKEMLEKITGAARVETVYGEPREVAGKTLIPVARVMYCGGGGGGQGRRESSGEGTGGGGGVGVSVQPLGMFVITAEKETWVPVVDVTRIVLTGCAVATVAILAIRKIAITRSRD
jgi:uncharacterized spore protein YtfJ